MTGNCCCRKRYYHHCRRECYDPCATRCSRCSSSSCNGCSASFRSNCCSHQSYSSCSSRSSCSLCRRRRCDEKKHKKKEKKHDGDTIICKRVCKPRKEWDAKEEGTPKVSYKDVRIEIPEKKFEMEECESGHAQRRGMVFNVRKAHVEGKKGGFVAWKSVRSSHSCSRDHYSTVIQEAKDCSKVVEAFLNKVDTDGWKVKVLIPRKLKQSWPRRVVIAEPFLDDYYTFYKSAKDLENMGSHTSDRVLQALLHFSIENSGRKQMMTNLEGYVNETKKTIFLSGPVMRKVGEESAHGKEADIYAFLRRHDCSRMCRDFGEAKSARRNRFCFKPV